MTIDPRLVMDHQLLVLDRISEVALKSHTLLGLLSEMNAKTSEGIPAFRLSRVHCEIGVNQQIFVARRIGRKQRNPDARANRNENTTDIDRPLQLVDDASCYCVHACRDAASKQEDAKFVAANPRYQWLRILPSSRQPSKIGNETLADLFKQRVSDPMPVSVVDGLESIKIEKEQSSNANFCDGC